MFIIMFSKYVLFLFLCFLSSMLLLPLEAKAQLADITITETQQMNFGRIIRVDPRRDFIVLSPNGVATSTTGRSIVAGATQAAQFTATGEPNTAFNISFGNNSGRAFLDGDLDRLRLDQFTSSLGTTPAFGPTGQVNFTVGSRLRARSQNNNRDPSGVYSGTYNATVEYQ